MSRVLKQCSEEMRQFLGLERFAPNKRVSEVLAEIDAMTPEQKRELSRDMQGPWGFNDIRAELEKMLGRHGRNIRVRDFVLSDVLCEDMWMCDLGVGD
jgi:hypothetical protein